MRLDDGGFGLRSQGLGSIENGEWKRTFRPPYSLVFFRVNTLGVMVLAKRGLGVGGVGLQNEMIHQLEDQFESVWGGYVEAGLSGFSIKESGSYPKPLNP